MSRVEIDHLVTSSQLHHLRCKAHQLELRMAHSNDLFMQDARDLARLKTRIDELDAEQKAARFAEYVSTPRWRYRVR